WRYDDSLDVLAVHGVGGVIGMGLLGLFAAKSINPAGSNGLFSGGGFHLLGVEWLALVVAVVYCFGVSYGLPRLIDRLVGLRVTPEVEFEGLDLRVHAETAYAAPGLGTHLGGA